MPTKIVSTKIQIPTIPETCQIPQKLIWKADKFNIGFSRIKYIFILKIAESKRKYKKRGVWRRMRDYGVGILTEENDYYYSTLTMNRRHLLAEHIDIFNKMFMQRFILTERTRVMFSDNINWITEPIALYWKCIRAVVPFKCMHVSLNKIFKCVNRRHRTVRVWKRRKFGPWHWELLIDALFRNNNFGFITDPDWEEKLKTMNPRLRDMQVYVAVGMLYLDILDSYLAIRARCNKRKAERKLEEAKQIESGEPTEDDLDKRDGTPWGVVL